MALVDSVKENNGDVRIFSSLHVSGEREYTDWLHIVCHYVVGRRLVLWYY